MIHRLFATREHALRYFDQYKYIGINQKNALSGAIAGFYYTNVAFVFDLLKVRAQFNQRAQIRYVDEIKRIYRTEGPAGFLKGYQGMLLRDFPGFAFYFCFYENLKRQFGIEDFGSSGV